MNITLLVYVEEEGSKQYDHSIDQIAEALKVSGHKPSIYCVHGELGKLISRLKRTKPDLIFNLLEQFGGRHLGLVEVTGLIDLLDIPYTGSGAGEIYLQEDKALTKKLLAYEKLNCPDFALISPQSDLETGGNLRMPLFVKPLRMDASMGVDGSQSLVNSTAQLMERVTAIHKDFQDAALCEQYVEGREFYVGVLGNQQPRALPPIEMDFSDFPEGAPHVMDAKAKFDESTPEYQGTRPVVAELPDELRARLQQVALTSYRALRIRDYGRVDLRLTETGEIYVIEVNANCYLERDSEFAMAAKAAGMEYPELISRIVELALERNAQASMRFPRRRNRRKATRTKKAAATS